MMMDQEDFVAHLQKRKRISKEEAEQEWQEMVSGSSGGRKRNVMSSATSAVGGDEEEEEVAPMPKKRAKKFEASLSTKKYDGVSSDADKTISKWKESATKVSTAFETCKQKADDQVFAQFNGILKARWSAFSVAI